MGGDTFSAKTIILNSEEASETQKQAPKETLKQKFMSKGTELRIPIWGVELSHAHRYQEQWEGGSGKSNFSLVAMDPLP